jgi:hypothetical protein
MPGFMPGIHVFMASGLGKDVDGRDKPGHDEAPYCLVFLSRLF